MPARSSSQIGSRFEADGGPTVDERRRAKHASFPESGRTAHLRGHTLQGPCFYVWDEDAARARAMARELGAALEIRPAGGTPDAHGPQRYSR